MMDKLWLIACFGGITGVVYLFTMKSQPHKGWLKLAERVAAGATLCWICQTFFRFFGVQTANSPLAAVAAGCLGIPGAALVTALSLWP